MSDVTRILSAIAGGDPGSGPAPGNSGLPAPPPRLARALRAEQNAGNKETI